MSPLQDTTERHPADKQADCLQRGALLHWCSRSVVDVAAVLKEASATALNYAGAHQQEGYASYALVANLIKRYGTDPIGGRTPVTRADVCPASYVSVRALRKLRVHAGRSVQ